MPTTYTSWTTIGDLARHQAQILTDEAAGDWTYARAALPGLVQTADYAAAVIAAIRATRGRPATQTSETVAIRMERAAALRAHPARYRLLIGESALRFRLEPPAVMVEQFAHLAGLIEKLPDGVIGIIPMHARALVLNDFSIRPTGRVVVELTTGEVTLDDPSDLAEYTAAWDALARAAVYGAAARELVLAAA